MQLEVDISSRQGAPQNIQTKPLRMSDTPGVWKYIIDLKRDLKPTGPDAYKILSDVGMYTYTEFVIPN